MSYLDYPAGTSQADMAICFDFRVMLFRVYYYALCREVGSGTIGSESESIYRRLDHFIVDRSYDYELAFRNLVAMLPYQDFPSQWIHTGVELWSKLQWGAQSDIEEVLEIVEADVSFTLLVAGY